MKEGDPKREIRPQNESLLLQVNQFIHSFYERLSLPENPDRLSAKVYFLVEDTNQSAIEFASPNVRRTGERQKEDRGECSIAKYLCPDGRNAATAIGGVIATFSKIAGGIPDTKESPIDGRIELADTRVQTAIERKGIEGKPIIQIFQAHVSRRHPKHSCGAMNEKEKNGEIQSLKEKGVIPQNATLEEANLAMYDLPIEAVTNHYNAAARTYGNLELQQIGIKSVYDTDDMSMYFPGKKKTISTRELTRSFENEIRSLFNENELCGIPGVMRNSFTLLESVLPLEAAIHRVTHELLTKGNFIIKPIQEYIDIEHPGLIASQQQAFRFYIVRNIAFQYLTGLFKEENPEHALTHHRERFISVSQDGITMGQFYTDSQSFATSISTVHGAVNHIKLLSSIMDKNPEQAHPHIVFVSKAISPDQLKNNNGSEERVYTANKSAFLNILYHPEILQMVKEGKIFLVPVLVHEKTREVLQIPNQIL